MMKRPSDGRTVLKKIIVLLWYLNASLCSFPFSFVENRLKDVSEIAKVRKAHKIMINNVCCLHFNRYEYLAFTFYKIFICKPFQTFGLLLILVIVTIQTTMLIIDYEYVKIISVKCGLFIASRFYYEPKKWSAPS